jgi:hypothetical protein
MKLSTRVISHHGLAGHGDEASAELRIIVGALYQRLHLLPLALTRGFCPLSFLFLLLPCA